MKKILIGTALILPALWAGMTWVASNKTEETFNNMLAQTRQKITEAAPIFTVEKKSFSKGFTSSTAKSIIHIDPEITGGDTVFKLTLDHTIYHGPLMLTDDGVKVGTSYIITTLDQAPLEEKTRQAIALVFAGKQPFISRTRTHFNTSITESIDIPELDIDSAALDNIFEPDSTSKGHFKLSLAGVSSEFTTNPEADFLEGWVSAGALKAKGNEGRESFSFMVNSFAIQFDIDELYHGAMLLGSTTFKMPEMLFSNGKQNISLKGIDIKALGDEQAELYSQAMTLDIDTLAISADNAAALFPELKVHMNFGVQGLDQVATKHMIDIGRSINKTQASLPSSNTPQQARQQREADIKNYLQALSDLIKPGLASNNIIELSNDKGISNLHLDLSYVSAKKLVELKTLKELIMALSAELGININKNQVDGTPVEMLLGSPMAQNAIKKNATAYTATATLNDGQLSLNGEAIPLLEQLGPMLEQPLDWDEYFR